jgi:hypothetical protein
MRTIIQLKTEEAKDLAKMLAEAKDGQYIQFQDVTIIVGTLKLGWALDILVEPKK